LGVKKTAFKSKPQIWGQSYKTFYAPCKCGRRIESALGSRGADSLINESEKAISRKFGAIQLFHFLAGCAIHLSMEGGRIQ
jgi:hypothetical protein